MRIKIGIGKVSSIFAIKRNKNGDEADRRKIEISFK